MAFRVAIATGTYGTAANWYQGANAPVITSSATTNVSLSTTPVNTATFTAPNTTNSVEGVITYLASKGTATTITATLQQSGVDTAHTVTVNLADLQANSWVYLKPATSYTYATTAAGAYRWKFSVDSGTTTTIAQTTTAGVPTYLSIDNRNVVPVSADNTFILPINGTTGITITVDGTRTVGSANIPGTDRSYINALTVGNLCRVEMDQTATSSINNRGDSWFYAGSELRCGTASSPLSSSYTATIQNAQINAALYFADGAKLTLQGSPKAYSKTTVVSGDGSTGSPLVTADPVDWAVGDKVIFAPATDSGTNYNETEVKFIRVKNSSTSYTLANTAGGAESALTYSHTGAIVGNFSNNIRFGGTITAASMGIVTTQTSPGNVDIDWVSFSNIGGTAFLGAVPTKNIMVTANVDIDNCTGEYATTGLFYIDTVSDKTFTNLMTYNTATPAFAGTAFADIAVRACNRVELEDCYSFSSAGYGIAAIDSFSCTLTDVEAYACTNSGATYSGFAISGSGNNTFIRCGAQACRTNGLYYVSGSANSFIEANFGDRATNAIDIYMGTGFSNAIFEDSLFGSATLISNYLNMTAGSRIRFNRFQDTDNNHRWYEVYGHGISEQTVIRSPGLSVKLVPENLTTGFSWSFKVPVVQNSIAGFRGYFLKNASLGTGVTTVSMYLPGNPVSAGVPDATATLDNTTGSAFTDADEQSVALTTEYDGDIPGAATIVVNIKSSTSGAALYADDFFNAGDRTTTFDSITGLNVWSDGMPLEVISPSVPSADDTAAAVWGYLKSSMTIPGTAGKTLVDAADSAELASIK